MLRVDTMSSVGVVEARKLDEGKQIGCNIAL